MNDPFAGLPVLTLAADDRAQHRHRFISAIAELPLPVRGDAIDVLYDIVDGWMSDPASAPSASADPRDGEQLNRFNDAVVTARGVIRETLVAVQSRDQNRRRYVSRIIRAADKPTLLYSEGRGEPTSAQPWLVLHDHVLIAALAETEAFSPEAHKVVAHNTRAAVLPLAGLAAPDDSATLPREERVRAARAMLDGVRLAQAPSGPRGPRPEFSGAFRIVRAVCDYRNRLGLPVAELSNGDDPCLIPSADTIELVWHVAEAWGVETDRMKLGKALRQFFNRLQARPTHALRADAEHIDVYNVGFELDD